MLRQRRFGLLFASVPAMMALAVCASCSSSSRGGGYDASFGDGPVPTDAGHHDAHDAKVVTAKDGSMGCGVCDANGGGSKDAGHDSTTIDPPDSGNKHDSGQTTTHDAGHDVGPPMPTHTTGVTIAVKTANGTVNRTYDITIPVTCDASHPVPLVFVLHGDGGNGAGMYGANFPIEQAAAAAGGTAIFVYPDGTDDNIDPDGAARAWDIYHDPGYNMVNAQGQSTGTPYPYTPGQPVPAMSDEPSGNADIDFFDAMLEYFEATYCVDTSRVWITGMSAGGYASNQFARWRSGVYTASAPQSGGAPFGNSDGVQGSDNAPTASDFVAPNYCVATTGKVPTLIIHGASDTTVDTCNAYEAQSYWELTNGCSDSSGNCTLTADTCTGTNLAEPPSAPTTPYGSTGDCVQTSGCGSNPVILCIVPGMGHSIWSEAPTVIWNFFSSL